MYSVKVCIFLLFISFCSFSTLQGQILNIESLRIRTDTTGWSGSAGFVVSASKVTQSYFNLSTNGHIQYQSKRNLFLLLGNLDLVNAGGEDFSNSGFLHLRYNYKVSDVLRLEAFTQVQYNSLTKIESRVLNGGGIRLKLSQFENAKFYYGLTLMNEYERLIEPNIINRDYRLSSYFSFTLAPVDIVTLTNTTYVQPKFGDISDYRMSNDVTLNFSINKHLVLSTYFHYLYDSMPPIEVPKVIFQFKNGITYSF